MAGAPWTWQVGSARRRGGNRAASPPKQYGNLMRWSDVQPPLPLPKRAPVKFAPPRMAVQNPVVRVVCRMPVQIGGQDIYMLTLESDVDIKAYLTGQRLEDLAVECAMALRGTAHQRSFARRLMGVPW